MAGSYPTARLVLLTAVVVLGLLNCLPSQESGKEAAPAAEPPPVPKGVEVMARGPVHEAFATLTSEPSPTNPVPKQPPKSLDEMPPDEKPEGDMVWIGGYWAWDDDRQDFLWVSGIWRAVPPGKRWVAGYWREDAGKFRWVPGFWAASAKNESASQDVTYLPAPPPQPETAPPGQQPGPDTFYVPGQWVWRGNTYVWQAGYWAHVQPGYVWVPAHYRWTPGGYVFIPGYWDYTVAQRGVLYAPVVVDAAVVPAGFVYTPAYAVRDTVVVDALFVRPCTCHYYFGDYYGPAYHDLGFETAVVYSSNRYDAIFVYERWEHRAEPQWASFQLEIAFGRGAGTVPVPPRTLVQQNVFVQQNITNVNVVNNNVVNNSNINKTTVNNSQVLMPTSQLAAAKGVRTVPVDNATRTEAKQQAQAAQQVAAQRTQTETAPAPGRASQPRTASLAVPPTKPVTAPNTVLTGASTPKGTSMPAKSGNSTTSAPGSADRPSTPAAGSPSPDRPSTPTTKAGSTAPNASSTGTGSTAPGGPSAPKGPGVPNSPQTTTGQPKQLPGQSKMLPQKKALPKKKPDPHGNNRGASGRDN
jgi:hypothetical protein